MVQVKDFKALEVSNSPLTILIETSLLWGLHRDVQAECLGTELPLSPFYRVIQC